MTAPDKTESKTDESSAALIELPQVQAPSVPLWAENYIYEISCAEAGAAFFMHLGRQPFDLDLWRDTFVADLGGAEVYAWRGFGRGASAEGPGGSQMRFRCIEPYRRWTLHFEGAALRASRGALSHEADGALRDGPVLPLRLRLEAVADGPVWDIGQSISGHDWGKAHYQQSMQVSGELVINGVVTPLQGIATRDHTRGPRDFSSLGSYAWIHGGFPGGRRFIALALDPRKGFSQAPVRMGVISEGGRLTPVEVLKTAIPATHDGASQRYSLLLKGPQGTETLEAECLSTTMLSVGRPNHLMLGPSRDPDCVGHMFSSLTRFEWNGQTCYGHSERSLALDHTQGPKS